MNAQSGPDAADGKPMATITRSAAATSSTPRLTPYGAPHRAPDSPRAHAVAFAKTFLRSVGKATAPLRVDPDYLIIGTKRGGTTSLARWLLEHPEVAGMWPPPENRKGAYFFDVNYGEGHAWYRSHFPTRMSHERARAAAGNRQLIGDATPYYLHHPHAPMRARRIVPDAKVIALLRNPIDRAHSHWQERTRAGVETLDFPDAIAAEAGRLDGELERMLADPGYVSFAHQHHSYVDQGRYAAGLRRWFDTYGRDRVLVIRSEDLYADPAEIYDRVCDFLEIGQHRPDAFDAWNLKPKTALDPDSRALVAERLAGDIAEVEALLGRDMSWS